MFYPHNDKQSETQHDRLTQATLGYWSVAPRELAQSDPQAWEAGAPVPSNLAVLVWLLVIILIALAVVL